MMKLDVKAFALCCGLLWGVGLFIVTWWILLCENLSGNANAIGEPTILGLAYRGYAISPVGSLIGLVWAFFDGLVGGAIFAWLYNRFCRPDHVAGEA